MIFKFSPGLGVAALTQYIQESNPGVGFLYEANVVFLHLLFSPLAFGLNSGTQVYLCNLIQCTDEYGIASTSTIKQDGNEDKKIDSQPMTTSSTTTFVNDPLLSSQTTSLPSPCSVPLNYITEATTEMKQDIMDFLRKPIAIANGTFSAASPSSLFTADLPDAMFTTLFAEKLNGFQGLRADIVFKLLLNSNDFQQGRLILGTVPTGNISGTNSAMRFLHLTTITQLPHSEIDISCERSCQHVLPYHHPFVSHDLINGSGKWGRVFIYVYSPFVTNGGTTTCGWTLYANFDKIQLLNPTYNTTVTLTDRRENSLRPPLYRAVAMARESAALDGPLHAQMMMSGFGTKKTGNASENEFLNIVGAPVISAASAVDKISSGNLIGAVPDLIQFALSPVSWSDTLIKGAASLLGFSKPLDERTAMPMKNVTLRHQTNIDGVIDCIQMGANVSNKLRGMPGFGGTCLDETSFAYLLPIFYYWTSFVFNTSNVNEDKLATYNVDPSIMKNTVVDGAINYEVMGPLALMTRIFQLWRGAILFRFKFVKTPHHSGRIICAFYPSWTSAGSGPLNNATSEYVHRTIFDLSAGSVFTVEVPYVNFTPYDIYGTPDCVLIMSVDNELSAPSNVPTSITCLVEVAGRADMEFALPVNNGAPPIVYIPQSVDMAIEPPETDAARKKLREMSRDHEKGKGPVPSPYLPMSALTEYPVRYGHRDSQPSAPLKAQSSMGQMGTRKIPTASNADPCEIGSTTSLGSAIAPFNSVSAAEYCIGERIIGLNVLARRPSSFYFAPTGYTGSNMLLTIRPFTVAATCQTAGALVRCNFDGDMYSLLGFMYAYSRGGVRIIRALATTNPTTWQSTLKWVSNTGNPIVASASPAATSTWTNFSPNAISFSSRDGDHSIQVPQYNMIGYRVNRPNYGTTYEPVDSYNGYLQLLTNSSAATVLSYTRCAADDCQFGLFLGVPPLLTAGSTPG